MTYSVPGSEARGVALWNEATEDVQPYLDRARLNSTLTIPLLYPPEGHNGTAPLYQPWRNIGARGVNHLASSLLLALFPPGSSFLRFTIPDRVKAELSQIAQGEDVIGEIESTLASYEREVLRHFEAKGMRVPLYRLLRLLIVGGNGLLFKNPKDGRLHVFNLTQYRTKRDADDNLLWIVVREGMSLKALPEPVREAMERSRGTDHYPKPDDKEVHVYTVVDREASGRFSVWQEVCGQIVDGSEGNYPEGKLPWLPQRWDAEDGESYGRSFVDNYIGDLGSLDSLSRSIIEDAAIAARTVFLRKPGAVVTRRQLANAANGEYLDGEEGDVTTVRVAKGQDYAVAAQTRDELLQSLKEAFMMTSAIQRDAERVTAEEIRRLAEELEKGLGGYYSLLSASLQLPLVNIIIADMTKSGDLPKLPKEVSPTVTTGLEALGRTADLQKLDIFVAGALQTFGPEAMQFFNMEGVLKRRATALGLDAQGLVRSQADVQAEQVRSAQMRAAEQAAGQMAGAAMNPQVA